MKMEQTGKVSLVLVFGAILCFVAVTVSLAIIAVVKLFTGYYFQFAGLTAIVGLLLLIGAAIMSATEKEMEMMKKEE
jgi:membrane protein implicated in regulation of membrane protease activity